MAKHNPHALHLLGLLHAQTDEFRVAERNLLKSVELSPLPHVWNDLAIMYRSQGRLDKAEMAVRKAIALSPDSNRPPYYAHLANIQTQAGNLKDAVASYRQALALRPDWPEVYNNIGELLLVMNDLEGAEDAFRKAIRLNSSLDLPHQNLGITLFNRGLHAEALACLSDAIRISPSSLASRSNKIMMMTYFSGVTEKQLHEEALAYASYAEKTATRYTHWPDTLQDDRPLHVGFVSGRFCHSPVMHFLEGLLRELKQSSNIKVSLYSNTPTHDGATEILKTLGTWRAIANLSDREAAATIYNDKIDILIDLAGHSKHNRLPVFCWKPAPIQAAWMEFGATTGLKEMDYIICDKWSVTPESNPYFVEEFWRLPHGRLCFTKPPFDTLPNELPALKNGYITFGSFNNFAKLNHIVFETWAEILKRAPNSRLVMSTSQLDNEAIASSIRNTFESLGVENSRLDILPPRPRNEFMMQYNLVDISLDPFPYQGVTTTVESLWMGVPVVMFAGNSFISRQSVNVHALLGLDEWMGSTREEYMDRAVSNAQDTNKLKCLRLTLRDRIIESPIVDTTQFASGFEAMLYDMQELHHGDKPS